MNFAYKVGDTKNGDKMCTAILYKNIYFGRNLDLERSYHEQVIITPRNYRLPVRRANPLVRHYAMIGMGAGVAEYPLYYEATNEKGLSMAGLNFPDNAYYGKEIPGFDNVAPFELIPWVLGQCATLEEAKKCLENCRLVNVPFSEGLHNTPLHWLLTDKTGCLAVESMKEGLKVCENPYGVLTNNPPFDYHRLHLNDYMALHSGALQSQFEKNIPLHNYSLGMGALGLPGDYSSPSRFVKAFFVKENSVSGESETENVNQFFHILQSVAMPKGCVWTENGFEYTRYSSCCNTETCVYYYTTYEDFTIRSVDLHSVDLDQTQLFSYKI